jgi:GPH family glycoside/pentoside/hexuronide:cation symporter
MSNEIQKVSLRERSFYGFGDLASCLFWQTITLYLLFFYTDVFGLSALAAGVMIGVSRLLDAFFDVIIGMTADRTKSRWGKFRPYLLWGAIPLAVAATLAFTTPNFSTNGKLIYAYVTFILFMFMYSFINIPYTALLGVISGDPVERTSASSFKFIGAYVGGFIVSATALPFAAHFGHGNVQKGWQMTLAIYGIAAVILFLITFLSTRERIQPIAKEKTSIDLDLGILINNGPWLMLFIITILFILFVCIRLSVTAHYFKYYIGEQASPLLTQIYNLLLHIINPLRGIFGKESIALYDSTHKYGFDVLASAFNTVGQGFAILGVILVPWFAKICGRKNALVILFVTALICTGAFYFLKPENLLAMFIFQTVGSLAGGPISALLWVLYADTADHSEWRTGRRATGLVFSASIMSNKIGWTVGSVIAGLILALTGFVANVAQNIDVQNGLKAMMSAIPVAAGVIALILIFFYGLDETIMKKIKEDLEARRLLPSVKLLPIPGISNILFSLKGRATKAMFWGVSIISLLFSSILYIAFNSLRGILKMYPEAPWRPLIILVEIILAAICLLFVCFFVCISIKRWHDLDRSGYMVLIELIPVIGWLTLIWLGFFKGTSGSNKFGSDLTEFGVEVAGQQT